MIKLIIDFCYTLTITALIEMTDLFKKFICQGLKVKTE